MRGIDFHAHRSGMPPEHIFSDSRRTTRRRSLRCSASLGNRVAVAIFNAVDFSIQPRKK